MDPEKYAVPRIDDGAGFESPHPTVQSTDPSADHESEDPFDAQNVTTATNSGSCDSGQWMPAAMLLVRTLQDLPDGTYYWQVRAMVSGAWEEADAGAWFSFTIDAPDPVREYIYLGDRLLAELNHSPSAAPVITYFHSDVVGSVRATTAASGAPVRFDYAPFGEDTTPVTTDQRRFAGKELDGETAFDNFGARYYQTFGEGSRPWILCGRPRSR